MSFVNTLIDSYSDSSEKLSSDIPLFSRCAKEILLPQTAVNGRISENQTNAVASPTKTVKATVANPRIEQRPKHMPKHCSDYNWYLLADF